MQLSSFFHMGISRLKAEELLLLCGEDGSFLVRDSESVSNAYVLCLLYQLRVHQYRILPDKDGRLSVQSEGDMQPLTFTDLTSLVQAYINRGDKNGLICPLRRPISPERSDAQEQDSDDDEFEYFPNNDDELDMDDKAVTKNIKSGLLHNFARLDLSACDGEFVEVLQRYIDRGLDKDADLLRNGDKSFLELQSLLETAGRNLQRELDVFLLKLAMVHDILTQDDDDRKKSAGVHIDMTGTSYVSYLAAKMQQCKAQLMDLQSKAEEVLGDAKRETCEEVDGVEAVVANRPKIQHPRPQLSGSSVRIPLSTFEVKLLKSGVKMNPSKLSLNVDIRQGRLFAVKPSKDFLDSSNTFTHDKILQLVKNTKDSSKLDVIIDGKKKSTYQFDSAHERENFCLQVRQMKMLHSQETDVDTVSVFIGTWNMGKSSPTSTLKFWLRCWGEGKSKDRTLSRLPHDIYVIGTQEGGLADKDWVSTLKATLKTTLMVDVELLESTSLWGIRLVILIHPKHRNKISYLQKSSVRTGIANALGNKGAVAISFMFNGTSMCFINGHLTSGAERTDRRNANFRDILKGLSIGPKNWECYDVTHKFHHVFFFGDLNYRVTEAVETVLTKVDQRDLPYLLEKDQLRKMQAEKKAFLNFNEAEISFMPTYRLQRHAPGYKYEVRKIKKTGERINVPSWCDRILWHSFPSTFVENSAYGSVDNLLNSDHRPVFASFVLGVTSQFVQNRASLQDTSSVTIIFFSLDAQILTSCKQCYIIEFSSLCLPDIIYCEPNKVFGDLQKPGTWSNPVWDYEELPKLHPLFGDQDYLEDQHLLIAVKGSGDDHESFGECILALKGMFETSKVQEFECMLTHHGEETGKLKGQWLIQCSEQSKLARSRKTYEVIALDTEYHDPEEIHSFSPPGLHVVHSTPVLPPSFREMQHHRSNTVIIHGEEEIPAVVGASSAQPQDSGIIRTRGNELAAIDGGASNGKSGSPSHSPGPPIPNKQRSRIMMMGQTSLQAIQRPVPPGESVPSSSSSSQSSSSGQILAKDSPPPIPRKLKPSSPAVQTQVEAPKLFEDHARPKTVQDWLSGLGLLEYLSLFLRMGCDSMGNVTSLTAAQVMKMGIKHPEHRTRILQSVRELSKYQNH